MSKVTMPTHLPINTSSSHNLSSTSICSLMTLIWNLGLWFYKHLICAFCCFYDCITYLALYFYLFKEFYNKRWDEVMLEVCKNLFPFKGICIYPDYSSHIEPDSSSRSQLLCKETNGRSMQVGERGAMEWPQIILRLDNYYTIALSAFLQGERKDKDIQMNKNGMLSCKFRSVKGSISPLAWLYLITQKLVNRKSQELTA